jgi:hypothetical protein
MRAAHLIQVHHDMYYLRQIHAVLLIHTSCHPSHGCCTLQDSARLAACTAVKCCASLQWVQKCLRATSVTYSLPKLLPSCQILLLLCE